MAYSFEEFGTSVVFVGDISPAMISPEWLSKHGLIGNEDLEVARGSENFHVTKQDSFFETDWFSLHADEARVMLLSKKAALPAVKDLAVSVLSLMYEIPVKAVGMNFHVHVKFMNVEDRHKIGDAVAPKGIWMDLFPGEERSAGLSNFQVSIQPCKRGEKPKNKDVRRFTIQPSSRVQQGIYFAYNNHIDVESRLEAENRAALTSAAIASRAVEAEWAPSWEEAKRSFDGLLSTALKP